MYLIQSCGGKTLKRTAEKQYGNCETKRLLKLMMISAIFKECVSSKRKSPHVSYTLGIRIKRYS